MKKSNFYIINGVLAVAIIVLYILHFTSQPSSAKKTQIQFNLEDSTLTLPVAYINVDSLLINYNFAKDLNEALMRKEENSRATLNQKESQLNAAAQEFQRKLQNNAFLSQERAEQEQQRILKMQQEYQEMAQKLSREFMLEQQKLNLQLADTIKVNLVEFNKNKNYEIIFSNTASDNILYADEKYDITQEVIRFLNNKYGPTTLAPASTKKK
ncbi:MAG: OmpH family outer membrane protein [Dysgonamonadaceae bacterium]|jgi:outer membrane protein|nr:OmpH family outer membrane protein [Dysgonamonadaceae bacterium]